MKTTLLFTSIMMFFCSTLFSQNIGTEIDNFNGVSVYLNGEKYLQSYGRHFSDDGYYYGKKWQCVEFVKRYYYDEYGHKFPDGYGHAFSFFNFFFDHGELNKSRGLTQFYNDYDEKPMVGDILCFPFSRYGHICIISEVGKDYIEVVQQNIIETTRQKHPFKFENGNYSIGNDLVKPIGWLRMPK